MSMSNEISVGDRVKVQGKVGDVVKVEDHEDSKCFHVVLEEGGRKRYFDTVTNIEKVVDPFDQLLNGSFDPKWKFDLLTEATELSLAFEYDQLLSLSNSRINLEPYQVECVHKVVNAPKQRFLIADDVGLGKTIEAGMILKELSARNRAKRVLIISPASLTYQWKRELSEKFDYNFWVYDSDRVKNVKRNIARTRSPWEHEDKIITSIDYAKQENVKHMLRDVDWDLAIFDEAHKLSKKEEKTTQRYKFGKLVANNSENLLLLTATPHNGNRYRFWRLIQLIDKYIFSDPSDIHSDRLEDIMVRRGKNRILDEDGEKVFKPRKIDTLPIEFTEKEMELYNKVTEYVKNTYNKAKEQKNRAVGFAMVILQKRMVSSVEAIHSSLNRRLKSLKKEHKALTSEDEEKIEKYRKDPDSLDSKEREQLEEKIIENATYKDPELLKKEIETLENLVEDASKLVNGGVDSKGRKLREMVENVFENDPEERVLIFTEYKDTLNYLREVVLNDFEDDITEIHGDVGMQHREHRENLFRDGEKKIMLATDAAGEGINLQFCHIMFNYDLPWNPNRIDQRIGRLHRYGQDKVVQIYHLLIQDTREGKIFERLNQKIERIEEDLGQMSEVLGSLLEDFDLEDHIMKAVSDEESVEKVDKELDEAIRDRKQMLNQSKDLLMSLRKFDLEKSLKIINKSKEITFSNEDIEKFVRLFFEKFGEDIENTRYKKQYRLYPPEEVTSREVPKEIERATFDKEIAKDYDSDQCEFVAFGHPLLDNIIDFCSQRDVNLGGSATLKKVKHKNCKGGTGAQFNWKISIINKEGEVEKEKLLEILLGPEGNKLERELVEDEEKCQEEREAPLKRINKLKEISFKYAKEKSNKILEEVKKKRQKRYGVKTEEIKKYFKPRIKRAKKKLEEAKKAPEGEELREANIGKAEKKLNELKSEKKKQLAKEENRRELVSEAPELLNCALVEFE